MALVDPGDPADLAASVRAAFADRYGEPPTTVGRAPGRVNLIGEHTDYNAGLVLPVALPHATYAAARARADELVRIASAPAGRGLGGHPRRARARARSRAGPAYAAGVVWALREAGHEVPGVDLLVDSRVPVGAGLSSSAALECSVGDRAARPARRRADRRRARRELVGRRDPGRDRGGRRTHRRHGPDGRGARPTQGAALLIDFDVPARRTAGPARPGRPHAAGHRHPGLATRSPTAATGRAGPTARRRPPRSACRRCARATLDAVEALADDRVRRRATARGHRDRSGSPTPSTHWPTGTGTRSGRLFDASHRSMRDDFEISCPELDCAVAVAVQAGAVAARMTGGGFGGSSVAVVPDERVEAVMRAVDAAFVLEGFRSPVAPARGAVRRRRRRARLSRRTQPDSGTPHGVSSPGRPRQFSA